jgi:hypothetical protein
MVVDDPHFEICVNCDRPFRFGSHVYAGRVVHGWAGAMICNPCQTGNRKGLVPTAELKRRLTARAIDIDYDEDGFIVIPR